MGDILRVECGACGYVEEDLFTGIGEMVITYKEAYCPICERIFSAKFNPQTSKPKRPRCQYNRSHTGDWLEFEQNKQCPKCNRGNLTIEQYGFWD